MFAIEAAIGLLALLISTLVIHLKMNRGFTKKIEQHAEDTVRAQEREDRRAKYVYAIPRVGVLMRGANIHGAMFGFTEDLVEYYPGDSQRRYMYVLAGEQIGMNDTFIFLGSIHEESLSTGIRWVGCYLRSHDSKIVYAYDYAMEEVK